MTIMNQSHSELESQWPEGVIRSDGAHTVIWSDGLRLTRIMLSKSRKQIVCEVEWQGVRHSIRLGKRVTTINQGGPK